MRTHGFDAFEGDVKIPSSCPTGGRKRHNGKKNPGTKTLPGFPETQGTSDDRLWDFSFSPDVVDVDVSDDPVILFLYSVVFDESLTLLPIPYTRSVTPNP